MNITIDPTKEMIEAGAQSLVSWDDECVWPDSWDAITLSAVRTHAERVWRSMYAEAATLSLPSEAQARSNLATGVMYAGLIRRSLKKAHRLVPAHANSQLIDLINHMDALAQQIEGLNTATTEKQKLEVTQ